MPTIMPHSELLTRAVKWINESLKDAPDQKIAKLIDEACMRFNLSPMDNEALIRLFSSDEAPKLQD